jgi:DNA replicative helicase MCM subunit Mcm2 (Cdc46/Mcm family)
MLLLAGKLVAVQGTVVRMSPVRPLVCQMHFICAKCANRIIQDFEDGKYMPPAKCASKLWRTASGGAAREEHELPQQ